jgi:Glycosyltransferase sugar-binding region containing DXD motif/Alpha 1,4-glycosyltransferase conserved region
MLVLSSPTDNRRSRAVSCCHILTLITLFTLLGTIALKHHVLLPNDQIFYREDPNRIPEIVHFVVGQKQEKNMSSFSFFNYLVFLAARRHIRPTKFLVHYYQEPITFWWNQAKHDTEIDLTLVKVRLVKKIFNRSVNHPAHRADVIRLQAMLQYGGIYLDMDVLAIRSFSPLLNLNDIVLAYEDDAKHFIGNAVILAKRNSAFIRRWYDAYQSFDGNCWTCHSVALAQKLASLYPNEVTVLPTETFYRPSWNEGRKLFASSDYDFSRNYAVHLWNTVNKQQLSKVEPDMILNGNHTFEKILRQAIDHRTLIKLKRYFAKDHRH